MVYSFVVLPIVSFVLLHGFEFLGLPAIETSSWGGIMVTIVVAAVGRPGLVRADWVRPGIMLYGCSPFEDESAERMGLAPVMTLKSAILAVQTLAPGERAGYAGVFVASRETSSPSATR